MVYSGKSCSRALGHLWLGAHERRRIRAYGTGPSTSTEASRSRRTSSSRERGLHVALRKDGLRPVLYIDNLFDSEYLLKGHSSAARRRDGRGRCSCSCR